MSLGRCLSASFAMFTISKKGCGWRLILLSPPIFSLSLVTENTNLRLIAFNIQTSLRSKEEGQLSQESQVNILPVTFTLGLQYEICLGKVHSTKLLHRRTISPTTHRDANISNSSGKLVQPLVLSRLNIGVLVPKEENPVLAGELSKQQSESYQKQNPTHS